MTTHHQTHDGELLEKTVGILAPRLKEALERTLSTEELHFTGLLVGALHALRRAAILGYRERTVRTDRPNDEYSAMLRRLSGDLETNALHEREPVHEEYLAGFYFNAAVARINALSDALDAYECINGGNGPRVRGDENRRKHGRRSPSDQGPRVGTVEERLASTADACEDMRELAEIAINRLRDRTR